MNFVESVGWRGNHHRTGTGINQIALKTVTFISIDADTFVATRFVDAIGMFIADINTRALVNIDTIYAIVVGVRYIRKSIFTVALK